MASPAAGRIRTRQAGVAGPRGGGVYVSELQRSRLLDAAFAVVAEEGYRRMTVRRVSDRAGMSNKTFYDLFSDREECFLAAFELALERLSTVVVVAWEGQREWTARVRSALGALLGFLEEEPALRTLVFVEALGAGPRVLARRAEVLEQVAVAVDQGRVGVRVGRELPPLTAEGIVGAAFGVIYARLIQDTPEPGALAGLSNALMATIVLPYRGHAAAARELARCAPAHAGTQGKGGKSVAPVGSLATPVDFRLTVRTHMVLAAVAKRPGANNRQISDIAGVVDQGQISKLLARLEGLGLLRNAGGETRGIPNAWHLTSRGEEIARLSRGQDRDSPWDGER
jgi:AcrR family transcriptional regulator/DNA-binding MarR family transcriptional regulator